MAHPGEVFAFLLVIVFTGGAAAFGRYLQRVQALGVARARPFTREARGGLFLIEGTVVGSTEEKTPLSGHDVVWVRVTLEVAIERGRGGRGGGGHDPRFTSGEWREERRIHLGREVIVELDSGERVLLDLREARMLIDKLEETVSRAATPDPRVRDWIDALGIPTLVGRDVRVTERWIASGDRIYAVGPITSLEGTSPIAGAYRDALSAPCARFARGAEGDLYVADEEIRNLARSGRLESAE